MSVLSHASAVSEAQPAKQANRAAVRRWLMLMIGLVVLMVMVGGATRLTGSGLSITEWRPVTGAMPPLNDQAWQLEFDKYRASPQYTLLNAGMDLAEFKFIYWWEWGHRQLGRFLGVVFGLGIFVFALTGALRGRELLMAMAIAGLGGLQGTIGWIMVASGLKPGMIAVAPIKLMLHLTLASIILALLTLFTARFAPAPKPDRSASRGWALAVLIIVLVQIALGALVAGSRAGLTFNTWPLMDGRFVPSADTLFAVSPWIENFADNVALVQFNHRIGAFVVLAVALIAAMKARAITPASPAALRTTLIAGLVLLQFALGVVTLIHAVPISLALAHQVLAMIVVIAAAWNVARSRAA
ncbi:COX15/CtaA family protein [Rhizobiales bacterium TNE-4]|nr:COX15/CtaA family protein [Rhizobiales bacterium TNE-4]MBV1827047.1 COX15/CtaA family protein [Rhizobiales bacterium TNE-4]